MQLGLRRAVILIGAVLAALMVFMVVPAVASATTDYTSEEITIVSLINGYRVSNGLQPLLVSDILSDAATKHSHDMAKYDFFSHITFSSDWFAAGSGPSQRMVASGYPAQAGMGENLAAGFDTASEVFAAWRNSPSHNSNMLDPRWKVIGVGVETGSRSYYGTYWTTDFGDFVDGTAHENGEPAPPDTEPPAVHITYPASGQDLTGSITVTITATDSVGVQKVELYANGTWIATDDAAPYAVVWNTSVISPGTYVLEARAYDAAGNIGVADLSVHVTNTNPTTTSSTTTSASSTTTTTTTPTSTSTTTTSTSTSTSTSTTSTTLPAKTFSDVSTSSPFYQAISALASSGVISGYSDGTFHPSALVTRAQFAKFIVRALGSHTAKIDDASHPSFVDVAYAGSSYPFDYVEEAADLNIVAGYSDGTFRPEQDATRLQIAVMLVRAAGDSLAKPPSSYSSPFGDVPSSGRTAVNICRYNNILSGKTSTKFDPYSPATRAEVAKMVYALMQVLQKLR
jgi:uncharacterized protein YkwD